MWATERVMPFGIFPASSIAQRNAYAQMDLIWIEFDRLEAAIELCCFLVRWTAQRKELGRCTRLAFGTCRQCTDDVCVVVLGAARISSDGAVPESMALGDKPFQHFNGTTKETPT